MEALLNSKQMATLLGVGLQTVAKYRKERKLPAVKMGNAWMFRQAAVEEWLKAQEVVRKPVVKKSFSQE